jgi:glycosyltransferase involved in cell wall biosynthesis
MGAHRPPTLSVLICTRNRAEKLKRAVDSVLANSFTNYELIVVDQSTDGRTAAALATIDDARLRYIHTDTVGVAKSRNIAVRESRAEIVVYTDDDCVCNGEWLASIHAEFQSDPSVEAVYGRVVPFGDQEGMICPCVNESTERLVLEGPAIPALALGGGNNIFADLMKGAMRGVALVFLAYSLRFDRVAFVYLMKTAYWLWRDRLGIGSAAIGLMYFCEGLALGPIYLLKRPASWHEQDVGSNDRSARRPRLRKGASMSQTLR